MILLNITLIIWIIAHVAIFKSPNVPRHWLFVTFEIIINAALFFEISLRVASLGKKYLHYWSNRFDVAVLILSLCSLLIYLSALGWFKEIDDLISAGTLIFRYSIQFLRLIVMVKNEKNVFKRQRSKIDFSTIPEEDGFVNYYDGVEETYVTFNSENTTKI